MRKRFRVEEIGVIHSPYKTKDECPIQGSLRPEVTGEVEVYPEYEEGLKTIETFSHIMLFYIFDRAENTKLCRPTFLDDALHGVFASRHPCRPNRIGISIVKLEKRNGTTLQVSGIDVLDNTPLIDIKPYIPRFDYVRNANNGWTEHKKVRQKPPGRE